MAGLAGVMEEVGRSGVLALYPVVGADGLVGLGLATAPGRACYVPVGHAGTWTGRCSRSTWRRSRHALDPLLADPAVLKVFHDAKAGLWAMARAGFGPVAPVDDAMLLSYAQDAGAHAHTLEDLSRLHLGHGVTGLEAVTGTGRAPAGPGTAGHRAGRQPRRRGGGLRAPAAPRPARAAGRCPGHRAVRAVGASADPGAGGDGAGRDQGGRGGAAPPVRRFRRAHGGGRGGDPSSLAGRPFNLGSPKVLGEILFDEMKLPGGRRTGSGTWGTDAAVLQTLAEGGAELPARILEWRQLAKLKSTYADALVTEINPETGRVHTTYAMAAATTGRLSSNDPNLQNIPIRTEEGGRIRRAFVAAPGHVLVSADYSQIELRLLAHVADVPALSEAFATGQDIHSRTASEVFGVPMAEMTGLVRRRAKAINFGIIYGISAFGLARQLQIEPGEAKAYIDAYFLRYPGIRAYMESTREEARIRGFVLTPFGRRCWVPGIADRNPAKRAYAERQASNAPLQGGAADIIKRAMVRLPAAIATAGLRGRMLLQVHDELLFETPEEEADATAALVRDIMQSAAALSVPLVVETGKGHSWAEAH